MNVRDLLIALLRYAIKGEALDKRAVEKSLSSDKMATLFKVSKKHDVAHIVCGAMEENGIFLDCEAYQSFLKEKEQAKLRYEMIKKDTEEICEAFESAQIKYIPLKGAVLRRLYPREEMRTSCDIDILVCEQDLDRACLVLSEHLSYTVEGKKTYHDISLFSPFGMHLELHYNIKENMKKLDPVLEKVWEHSQSEQGKQMHLESNEFLAFHLLAHAAYHFVNGGCGLRAVLDAYLLLEKCELDKEELEKLLSSAGLVSFAQAIISLGEYWFGDKRQASHTVEEIEKYILLGGVYGTEKQSAAARQAKSGGKIRYFWSRIFLPYESLAVLYPVIKRHKILTPFCQIARWLGVIFKGKRIKREIKNIKEVDSSQTEGIKALLKSLEL